MPIVVLYLSNKINFWLLLTNDDVEIWSKLLSNA